VSSVHRYDVCNSVYRNDDEERKMKRDKYSIRKNSSNSSYLSFILVECRLFGMMREAKAKSNAIDAIHTLYSSLLFSPCILAHTQTVSLFVVIDVRRLEQTEA